MRKLLLILLGIWMMISLSGCSSELIDEVSHMIKKVPYPVVALSDEYYQDKYYYQQLSDEERVVYKEIMQGLIDGLDEIYLHSTDAERIHSLFQFVMNDHPDLFWCDGSGQTRTYQGIQSYSVLFPNYQYDTEQRQAMQQEIELVVDAILSGAPKDGSDYEKIKYVYEYLIEHSEYDVNAEDSQNICSVFVHGRSVCAGYARATQYLLDKLRIPCIYVTGQAQRPNSEEWVAHAWNIVLCDDEYYHVDTTWGDPVYLEGQDRGSFVYDYLCVSDEELLLTHQLDCEVAFPKCVSMAHNYYVVEGMYYESCDEDLILRKMMESIDCGKKEVVFKFADRELYEEAREMILQDLVKEAADYLGKKQGLHYVEYSYKDEPVLYKISIIWKYE